MISVLKSHIPILELEHPLSYCMNFSPTFPQRPEATAEGTADPSEYTHNCSSHMYFLNYMTPGMAETIMSVQRTHQHRRCCRKPGTAWFPSGAEL